MIRSARSHRAALFAAVLVLLICSHASSLANAQGTTAANQTAATDSVQSNPLLPVVPISAGNPSTVPPTANPTASPGQNFPTGQQRQQQLPASQQQQQQGGSSGTSTAIPKPDVVKTQNGLEAAATAQQGPVATVAPGTNGAVNLVGEVPGCSDGSSPYLPPGLDGQCEVQGVIARPEVDLYTFTIPDLRNATRGYRVLLVMRTMDGDAQLGVSVPSRDGTTDTVPDQIGSQVYSTEITTEVILEVPWDILREQPGRYVISIARARRRALYTLQVLTPWEDVRLAEPDLTAIRDLYQSCCVASAARSSLCTQFLARAVAPNSTAAEDLCQVTPMTCNAQGRLTQLAIAQGGLVCPTGLPDSFANLDQLYTLDLAFNNINDTAARVGQILASLPNLHNAFLRYTNMRGNLTCDLVGNPSLTRLSISGNEGIGGRVPDCFFRDATLEELYMSQTSLGGQLPDVVPAGRPLRLVYAINFIDPDVPGFSGTLPTSLVSSPSIMFLDLSNNNLAGGVPGLSPNMVIFNISGNALDGGMAGTLPTSLRTFDVSYNALGGTLPAGIEQLTNLTLFDVDSNRFTGSIPAVLPQGVLAADFSGNAFSGLLPRMLPSSLYSFDLSDNLLTGPLPELPAGSNMHFFQVFNNSLTGPIPTSIIAGSPVVFLDLHDNRLSGTLEGSSSSSSGGSRKLLQPTQSSAAQQQQQQAPQPWELENLLYLDVSGNQIGGSIPAGLGALETLVYLDLADNRLTGGLEPFASALAQNASTKPLMYLNVSSNQLTGEIPESLAAAPMLDPERITPRDIQRGDSPPRVVDLSNNAFGGPYPMFLVDLLLQVETQCQGQCDVIVDLSGANMKLSCPTDMAIDPSVQDLLSEDNFTCIDSSGQPISLLAATTELTAAPPASTLAPGQPPTSTLVPGAPTAANASRSAAAPQSGLIYPTGSATATQQQGGQGGMSAGAIAGAVIGSVVGAALLALAGFFGYRRVRRHRSGWRKDDFGGNPMNDAFGVTGVPPSAFAPAANGNKNVTFANGDPQYPHSPYERTQAGIELQNSRENPV